MTVTGAGHERDGIQDVLQSLRLLYLRAGLQCLQECPKVLELRLAVRCCVHRFLFFSHVSTC